MQEKNNTEKEFDLDPVFSTLDDENTPLQVEPSQTEDEFVKVPKTDIPEPLAPIMPKIDNQEYKPMSTDGANKGMKVFAAIVALLVIVSISLTSGYFLGVNQRKDSNPTVDLAEKPKAEDAMSVSEIYNLVNKSVVGIYVYNKDGISSSASGVIYSEDGYIVTNDHIYDDVANAKFKVYTYDGKMYSAEYVAGDTRSDLAVLKVLDPVGFKPATFGNSKKVAVGETVVAVGRPNGATEPASVSEGVVSVSSTRASITSTYTSEFIQTDSAINPGSSGGALSNIYGQVIGITSAKLVASEYEGVGYAIPTAVMKKNIDKLIKYKCVKGRAKLGISYKEIDSLSAEVLGVPSGLQIASIEKSSDLYGRQISEGDIITHLEGVQITDASFVLDTIDNSSSGDALNFTVYLAKTKKSVNITVKLLEDVGSSSYNEKEEKNNTYNSSEFDFPNGD